MIINKWFFQYFKSDIKNLNFIKTIPFITWSDLQNPRYELIESVLKKIGYNKDLLISVGQKPAPFGITILPENDDIYNELLNSCNLSFVFAETGKENDYLLKSVLAGVMPICDINHISIKRLGLTSFAATPDVDSIENKLNEILDKKHIFQYRIWKLSQQYRRKYLRWNKDKK